MAGQPDGPSAFGIAIKGRVLRQQMHLRGLTGSRLARLAGVSEGTISNALAGRRLHPATFKAIAAQLAKAELVPGAEQLAATDEEAVVHAEMVPRWRRRSLE